MARAAVVGRLEQCDATTVERRAAWLVAVLLGLQGVGADVGGGQDDGVVVDAPALAARAGLSPADCERGVDLLRAAGVLVATDASDDQRLRFAPDVRRPLPAADAVDWDMVLDALHGNAAAMLTAWAFADLLKRPDRFAAIPRAVLQAHTLYGEGMIKRALASLVSAGVVDRVAPNAYRFTERALGRATSVRPAREVAAPAPAPPQRPAADATLVQFVAAGVPLALPRDTTVELETEIDGRRTTLRLRFPSDP